MGKQEDKLTIIVDSQEKLPLCFVSSLVDTRVESLDAGDYTAEWKGVRIPVVVERKSCNDLFGSFSKNYPHEKAKWLRAQSAGLKYIIGVEGTASRIRQGCTYIKGGVEYEVGKSGIAQLRQLMSISVRYGVDVWMCDGRRDLSLRIQEFFLAYTRL